MSPRYVHPTDGPAPFTPDKSSKIRFDGSCCLNLRSITGALDLLSATPARSEPITSAELTSVLWFVEMCVMSRALYFDGTVPQSDIAKAIDQIGEMAKLYDVEELKIDPIRIQAAADILLNATAAVREAAFIMAELKLAHNLDQSVKPAEHEVFQGALYAAEGLHESDRTPRALELLAKNFRGSKCVAALVAAGPSTLALARKAYETHPNDGPLVTSALINRFRLNYLNQLASWRKGTYAPDPGFEPVSDQHRKLFYQYLVAQVANDIPAGKQNILAENMLQRTPLPPIGLFALMLTPKQGKPIDILLTALNYFKYDNALQKYMWGITEEGLRIPLAHPDLGAYGAQVTEQFKHHHKQLERKAAGITKVASVKDRVREYVIPAVVSVIADFVPLPGKTLLGGVLTSLAEHTIGESAKALGDALLGRGCNSYMSQYRSLRLNFLNTAELAQPLAAIGARVERVFGRPFAGSGGAVGLHGMPAVQASAPPGLA
jgi:hypothetical protein